MRICHYESVSKRMPASSILYANEADCENDSEMRTFLENLSESWRLEAVETHFGSNEFSYAGEPALPQVVRS